MKHQILKNSGKLLRPLTFSLIFWNPLRFMDLPLPPSPFLPLFALMKFMSSLKVSHFVFVASSVDGEHGRSFVVHSITFRGKKIQSIFAAVYLSFSFKLFVILLPLSVFFFICHFFIERIICKQFSR